MVRTILVRRVISWVVSCRFSEALVSRSSSRCINSQSGFEQLLLVLGALPGCGVGCLLPVAGGDLPGCAFGHVERWEHRRAGRFGRVQWRRQRSGPRRSVRLRLRRAARR